MILQITNVRLEEIRGLLNTVIGATLEHITHIGNLSEGWVYTKEDAIKMIESGACSFYTKPQFGLLSGIASGSNGHTTVEVVAPLGRAKYLRTNPNDEKTDNLLSLPRF
jgi:hypothetical protein